TSSAPGWRNSLPDLPRRGASTSASSRRPAPLQIALASAREFRWRRVVDHPHLTHRALLKAPGWPPLVQQVSVVAVQRHSHRPIPRPRPRALQVLLERQAQPNAAPSANPVTDPASEPANAAPVTTPALMPACHQGSDPAVLVGTLPWRPLLGLNR